MKLGTHLATATALSTLITTSALAKTNDADIDLNSAIDNPPVNMGLSCNIVEPAQLEPVIDELGELLAKEVPGYEPKPTITYKRAATPPPAHAMFSAYQLDDVFAATINHGALSGNRIEYNRSTGEVVLNGEAVLLDEPIPLEFNDRVAGTKTTIEDIKIELGVWDNGGYFLSMQSTTDPAEEFSTHLHVDNGSGYHLAFIKEHLETVATINNDEDIYKTLQCSAPVTYPEGTDFHDVLPAMRQFEQSP